MIEWLKDIDAGTLTMLIPIVAILTWGVISIVKAVLRHYERVAMIKQGMHPDEAAGEEGEGARGAE